MGILEEYHAIGGVAQPGVFGTETQVVTVDMRRPTIETVEACRPDVTVRLEDQRETYPWEGVVEKREREKYQPRTWHGSGKASWR